MEKGDIIPGRSISFDAKSTVSSITDRRSVYFPWASKAHSLDFVRPDLIDREEEVSLINQALNRASSQASLELVLVHGPSGTGKTTLVESLRQTVFDRNGLFAYGKSDQNASSNAPYSALSSAFSDMCDLIRLSESRQTVQQAIQQELGDDVRALSRIVPSLSYLVEVNDDATEEATANAHTFIKFKILCRTFLRAVSSEDRPIVLVFDDLQFADGESIDVIHSLTKDNLPNTLLFCLYRDDESSETPPLRTFIRNVSEAQEITVTNVQIKELNKGSIIELISTVLNHPAENTEELAELLLSRTQGNVYFCLRFLEMLQVKGLLSLDEDTNDVYRWDMQAIRDRTSSTENVVQIMARSIYSTSPIVKAVLLYASFVGFRFSSRVVEIILEQEMAQEARGPVLDQIWKDICAADLETQDVTLLIPLAEKALTTAEKMGFIERVSDATGERLLKFTHDNVQNCLLQLISDSDEQDYLHLRIGNSIRMLIGSTSQEQEEELICCAASYMNKAKQLLDSDQKWELIILNLRAGEISASKFAYIGAAGFLHHAMDLLEAEAWMDNYEVCLQVYDMAAQYQYCVGNFDRSGELVDIVLAKARSVDDKLRAMRTQVRALLGAGRLHDTVDAGLKHIAALGLTSCPKKYPKLHSVIIEFCRCRRMVRRWNSVETMPVMDNEYLMVAMEITFAFGYAAHLIGDELRLLQTQLSLRWCRVCLEHGLSAASPVQIAAYAFALIAVRNFDGASRMSVISEQMQERCNRLGFGGYEYIHIDMQCALLSHWKRHLLSQLRPKLEQGFRLGMEVVDTAPAFNCLNNCVLLEFLLAIHPFTKVRDIVSEFVKRADEYKLLNFSPLARALLKSVEYFMGSPQVIDPGTSIEIDDLGEATNVNELLKTLLHFYRLIVAFHFDNDDELRAALRIIERNITGISVTSMHFVHPFLEFYVGMAHYVMYSQSGKRRNWNRARSITSKFEKYERKGLINRLPLLRVLQLEKIASLRGTNNRSLEDALIAAVHACEQQDSFFIKALAKERAAAALVSRDDSLAKRLAYLSLEVYASKDMFGKMQYLDQKFGLDNDGSRRVSSSVLSQYDSTAFPMAPSEEHEP